tara:strand:- start:2189 stop:2824 length:636 start_codon:yes stop_codon:yes gene_type:complete
LNDIKHKNTDSTHDICIMNGEKLLAAQLSIVENKGYDFAPPFQEMTIHLYLIGVMWRHGERLDVITNPREHAFESLNKILVKGGMSNKIAAKRIALLKDLSQEEGSNEAYAVTVGYQANQDDNSLDMIFDEHRDEVRVSGALWRFYSRGKRFMLLGGSAAAIMAIFFVTLYAPTSSGITILASGLFAAALVVMPTFIIGVLIYRIKFKKKN